MRIQFEILLLTFKGLGAQSLLRR